MKHYNICMTIAGSDPSGGAGLQADIKTFTLMGCYAQAVPTAITVQNTMGVSQVVPLDASLVEAQIKSAFADALPSVVKIGLLPSVELIRMLANVLKQNPAILVVIDPVLSPTLGGAFLDGVAVEVFNRELLPLAHLVTPNLDEYVRLTHLNAADFYADAASVSSQWGGASILLKGGHRTDKALDILFEKGRFYENEGNMIPTKNTHGTGCVLSSAIAARLSLGDSLPKAVSQAKQFISQAILAAADYKYGDGHGPLYLLPSNQ